MRAWGAVSARHGGFGRAVSGISKTEDWEKNEGQENQAERKAGALAEIPRDAAQDKDGNDDIHERDKIQQKPPPLLAGDFDQAVNIKDGNDASPTRLSRFDKNLPHANDSDEHQDQVDHKWHAKNEQARGSGYGGIGGGIHNVLVMVKSPLFASVTDILSTKKHFIG
jgi:hypothetical protein